MKHIIYTRPDGGLSVVTPCISRDDPRGFTEQDALDRAMQRIPDTAINVRVVDEIPADRTFRNAWRDDGHGVGCDMPTACDIHMNRIRRARDAELKRLDVEFMRAVETGDDAAQYGVRTAKQRLRDLPDTFDLTAAKTPEELKALWPDILPLR